MKKLPFTTENFEATAEQVSKANDAYILASVDFFDGVDLEDQRLVEQLEQALAEKIGFYFNDGLTASEIATWAISK